MNRLRSSSQRVVVASRTSEGPKLSRVRIAPRRIAPPLSVKLREGEHDDAHISVIVHLMIIALGLAFFSIACLLLP